MLFKAESTDGNLFTFGHRGNWSRTCDHWLDRNECSPPVAMDSMDPCDVCLSLWYLRLNWVLYRVLGVELLLVITVMKETRSTIILTRLARKLRKETGNPRYRAHAEDERGGLRTLIYISCTRPLCKPETVSDCWIFRLIGVLDLLATEPTVLSFSVSQYPYTIFCYIDIVKFLSDMVRFCMGHSVWDDRIQWPYLQGYPRI